LARITNRTALWRLVGEAGQLGRIRQFFIGDSFDGEKFHRLAVSQRDSACLVEQQRVDVSRRLDRLFRS